MNTSPGDIFVVRNVANLVPPYQPDHKTYHGTSAAIEFAVMQLKVEHIIVMGHSGCGGIQALVENDDTIKQEFSFITGWINIAKDAKVRALDMCQHSNADKYSTCEKEGIITSVNNLMTFPYIKQAVIEENLDVNGWYFSISDGKIHILDDNNSFKEI
jgi:carbonic anhydrase